MSISRRRHFCIAGLLAALIVFPHWAAAQVPVLRLSDASVVETDSGTTPMVFRIQMTGPATEEVTGQVEIIAGTAQPGTDYVDPVVIEFAIPPGTTQHEVTVEIVGDLVPENDEYIQAIAADVVGAEPDWWHGRSTGTIIDDEPMAEPPYAAIDDRVVIAENTSMWPLNVLENDVLFGSANGQITLLTPPNYGTATVRNDIGPPYIEYRVNADFSGEERLVYRYCQTSDQGEFCDEGFVHVVIRPWRDIEMTTDTASTWMTHRITELRALPGARFVATPLAAPEILEYTNGVDVTPGSPWDNPAGLTWNTYTHVASPEQTSTHVIVQDPDLRLQAIAIGVDTNGDGQPSPDEMECFVAQSPWRCDMTVQHETGANVVYWVLVQNLTSSEVDGSVEVFAIPGVTSDGSLHATGPGHVERGEDFDLLVGYRDDTIQADEHRAGFVTFMSDAATEIGDVPVIVNIMPVGPIVRAPAPLIEGRAHRFELLPGEYHRYTIIDIPPGSTRLRVTSTSAQDIDLYLVPLNDDPDPDDTVIGISPPVTSALASATGPGGNHVVEVTNALAAPGGRWYVVAHNAGGSLAPYTLLAQVDATAPIVRDGSYFNPDRSGSGLFLYPAGDQWTGLWYTYLADGTPTWYYLQAPQPGVDGLWTSTIFRSAWDGDSNVLVGVGDVVITPNGADRFQMTYRLDGISGSQPLESFGRGCPLGGAIDVSSTWYDPAHAGTGYSVQMFPEYEYYAAYYYDEQGIARFVAAELNHFGGTTEDLVIQQLQGDCPTCTYDGLPVRTDIGVLSRRFLSNTFDYIAGDLEYEIPLVGGWTSIDYVVPLGGPGTTQGCAP